MCIVITTGRTCGHIDTYRDLCTAEGFKDSSASRFKCSKVYQERQPVSHCSFCPAGHVCEDYRANFLNKTEIYRDFQNSHRIVNNLPEHHLQIAHRSMTPLALPLPAFQRNLSTRVPEFNSWEEVEEAISKYSPHRKSATWTNLENTHVTYPPRASLHNAMLAGTKERKVDREIELLGPQLRHSISEFDRSVPPQHASKRNMELEIVDRRWRYATSLHSQKHASSSGSTLSSCVSEKDMQMEFSGLESLVSLQTQDSIDEHDTSLPSRRRLSPRGQMFARMVKAKEQGEIKLANRQVQTDNSPLYAEVKEVLQNYAGTDEWGARVWPCAAHCCKVWFPSQWGLREHVQTCHP